MDESKSTKIFWYSLLISLAAWCHLGAAEIARHADDFVDSMGINLHLEISAPVYNEPLIGGLGLRHFRSNVKPSSTATLLTRLTSLYANYGTRVNIICDSTLITPIQYRDLMKGAMFESIEGLNEPDGTTRSYLSLTDNAAAQSYPATLTFQQDLFNAMSSDPATVAKTVLSPAMSNPANSVYLRGVAADVIAMHSYPAQQMPTGGLLTSYVMPSAELMASPNSGVMTLIASETGYQGGNVSTGISDPAAAKYIPRTYAEYFRLGIAQTYLYEMVDKAGSTKYGLLDSAFGYKPAYTTVKNLVSLLGESTWNASRASWVSPATFSPGVLDYTISGGASSVHHVLLQKSDGTFYLLLWQEVPSYDSTLHLDITNPTVPVSLAFNISITSAALYNLQSATPIATYGITRTLTVNVPDEVVVLQLTPGAAAVLADPVISIKASGPSAVTAPLQSGLFTVTRTGSTAAALTVFYTIGGTAINGTDYGALAGSVQIPAGQSSAGIVVSPRNPLIVGRKTAILTVATNVTYNIATNSSSTVFINANRTVVADFELSAQGWSGGSRSAVSRDLTNADTGIGALKWSYSDNDVDRWSNNIRLTFPAAQDWSAVSSIELRFKEDGANPISDTSKPVYFTWGNNGVDVGGGYAAAKFPLTHEAGYRTISLDLREFPRDKMTSLTFYVDGNVIQAGSHVFYIDNIIAVTDSSGNLDDMEQYGAGNWSGSPHSVVQADDLNADSGQFGLRWTYTDDGTSRWSNAIKLNFPQPRDFSRYSTLSLRFKEDAANSAADAGKKIYFDWSNNGVGASSGTGVASFALKNAAGYRTVELPLAEFNRDRVNYLYFYIDGGALVTGKHTWYLDNVSMY